MKYHYLRSMYSILGTDIQSPPISQPLPNQASLFDPQSFKHAIDLTISRYPGKLFSNDKS